MKKRMPAFVFLFVCACLLFTACQRKDKSAEAAPSAEKPTVKFYGKIVEYSSGEPITAALTEALKDKYKVEALQVDWGNLDQVIRTGIASGQPCDIYNYWPQYMALYVKEGMALDLSPYLDANNGEWRKTFNQNLLKIAEFDGKVYNIPITSNFPTILVNVDLFKQAGIAVPKKWTWDEFLSVCKSLKDKGIFPFANPTDNQKQHWFFSSGVLSLGKDRGLLEDLAAGKIPCTDPLFKEVLDKTRDLYNKGYLYPGEGAVSLTTDESRAAFSQGKVALSAEVAAGIVSLVNSAPFETAVVEWPSMGRESVTLGGCDGLFIPSNVADPEAAVAVLKEYTSAKIQQINIDNGFAVAIDTVNVKDETVKGIMAASSNVYPYEFYSISPELNDYVISQLLAELVLGSGAEACIRQMETLRQSALAK
jgi:ABC-type glycerol-3-phosphate transport system substrate-binding protein